jgi:hypothetical protein
MLAGEVSSTRKKQELVIQSNSSSSSVFSLYYKGSLSIDWGDGTKDYLYTNNNATARVFSHTYSIAYTGDIKIRGNVNLIRRMAFDISSTSNLGVSQSQIQKLSTLDYTSHSYGNWQYDITNLPNKLTHIYNAGSNTSYGNINNATFSNDLAYISIGGNNTISGNISNFFGTSPNPVLSNLTNLSIDGNNTLYGDLISVARGTFSSINYYPLTYFYIGGNNTISGDIDYLLYLPALQTIHIDGQNTVGGPLYFYYDVKSVYITGNNTISGDIGVLAPLPGVGPYITSFDIRGNNTIGGDLSSLVTCSTFSYFYLGGQNGVTGDIQYINTQTIYLLGQNTAYGDISTLKSNLTTFNISGINTITGDISYLSSLPNLNYFVLTGRNSVYGDIQYLPSNLTTVEFSGNSFISGTISSLNTPNLKTFKISATNSISGNISDLPSTVNYLQILKNNNKLSYTGKTWPENMGRVYLQPLAGKGLTTAEVDQMLIDLSNVTNWITTTTSGYKVVYLAGHNEPHSALSNVAIGILISKGVSVSYNI